KRAEAPALHSTSARSRRSRQNASVKCPGGGGGDQRSRWPSQLSEKKRATAAAKPGRARRSESRGVFNSGHMARWLRSGSEDPPLLSPRLHRRALEAALGELVPAADHVGEQRVGVGVHVPLGRQLRV